MTTLENNSLSGNMNVRRIGDLIEKVESIRQTRYSKVEGTTNLSTESSGEKLTFEEIQTLATLNAGSIAEMKNRLSAEASNDAFASPWKIQEHQSYWEGYRTRLDAMINQYQGELLDIHLGSNRDLAALRVAHDNIMKLKNSPAVVPISTVAPATTITRPAATSNTETAGTNQPTVTDNHSSAVTEHEEILTSNPHKPPEKQKQKRSDKMKLDYSVKHLVDDKGIAITGTKFDKEIQNILAENSDSVSKKVASIRELQSKLGVTPDGDFGPKSQATLLNTKKETTDVGAPAIVASAPIAVASAPAKAPDRTASVPTQPASATDTPTKPAIATSAPIAAASNPKTQQTPAEKTTPKKSNEPDNGVNGWAVAAWAAVVAGGVLAYKKLWKKIVGKAVATETAEAAARKDWVKAIDHTINERAAKSTSPAGNEVGPKLPMGPDGRSTKVENPFAIDPTKKSIDRNLAKNAAEQAKHSLKNARIILKYPEATPKFTNWLNSESKEGLIATRDILNKEITSQKITGEKLDKLKLRISQIEREINGIGTVNKPAAASAEVFSAEPIGSETWTIIKEAADGAKTAAKSGKWKVIETGGKEVAAADVVPEFITKKDAVDWMKKNPGKIVTGVVVISGVAWAITPDGKLEPKK